jgi:4-amino-4-deoxy-L-arabinose transferase-like glycosyltransferase
VLAGVFFGLSFLSKGPVSLYALWLPFLIAFGWVYRFSNFNKKWIGITIFSLVALVISVSWYLYIYIESPNAIETIGKKAWFNWSNYNARPFYYYWSFIVQSGVWTIPSFIGLLYPYLKDKVRDKKAYTFTLIWTLASVILLSIIPEKKSRFLLPVLIPLACNTAFYIDYLIRHFYELKNSRETGIVYFNFGAIAIIGMLFPISGYIYFGDALSGKWIWYALLSISLLIIGFFILKGLFRKNFEHVFYLSIGYIVAIMLFGMPMASSFTINEQYKPLSTLKDWERDNNMKTYAFKNITPELLWSYGGTMELLLDNDELHLPSEEKFAVIVNQEHNELFESTFERFHVEKVDRFDMNPKGPGDRSHKTRLWRNLYVVTKAYIALEASEAPHTQESQEGFQKTSQ